jgi:guanylate kinase
MPTGLAPIGNGKAIIFSAPSGAGKTTMVKGLMTPSKLSLGFSISATTRPPRGDEKNGEAYYYLTQQEFDSKVNNGDFIEWEEVYPGLCYGTLRSEVERMWSEGITPVFDVDVVGGLALKKVFGTSAMSVFVMPPSMEVLEQRLRGRGTESEKNVVRRLAKAGKEMQLADSFDVKLVNDDLQKAILTIINTADEFLKP